MRPSSITPMGTKFQRRRGGVHMGRDETDSAMGNASSARKLEQAGTDSPGGHGLVDTLTSNFWSSEM